MNRWLALLLPLIAAALPLPAAAQVISGVLFDDRNGNGIKDPGEPALRGVTVRLVGEGAAVDLIESTAGDGSYAFSPGAGCHLVSPVDPVGWRMSQTREDRCLQSTPGYNHPVGQRRYAKLDNAITNLGAGAFRQSALGDSIAFNFNFCGSSSFQYNRLLQLRLVRIWHVIACLVEMTRIAESSNHLCQHTAGKRPPDLPPPGRRYPPARRPISRARST